MATIKLRESGRWQVKIRRQGLPPATKTFRAKSDAEAWARKSESEIERGLWRDSGEADRLTLREALDRYEAEVTTHKRSTHSERSILSVLRDHRISGRSLSRIDSSALARLRDEWLSINYAPATIHRRFAVLAHVFEVAKREWSMPALSNPVRSVRLPSVNNERTRRVSDAEIKAICDVTGSQDLSGLIRLAVETAMRRSELCGLRWEHVDLRARTAHLPDTKNGHNRDVPLSSAAVAVLRGMPRNISGRVFNLRPDSVTQAFSRAVRRAGLADVHFHDLRHEATSRLADVFQAHELAKITGHRDMRMVLRYYHPRAEDLAKRLG